MDPPAFILSLDCEGRWGAADRPARRGADGLAGAMLETAYRRLVALLDRYETPATFAFVSAFFLTAEEARAHPEWFEPLPVAGADWFAAFRRDLGAGNHDGWLCPRALETVRAAGGHEIASHGFSHVPLGQDDVGEAVFRREMEAVRAAEALRGLRAGTFVYPRNRVGYAALLPRFGFRAYRPALARNEGRGAIVRGLRLLDDANPFEPPVRHGTRGAPTVLPAGRMLPVRTGARRWLPPALIRRKFEVMIDQAIASGRVVHVFAHPHNFVTGAAHYGVLEGLLAAVARRAQAGEIEVLTHSAYCGRCDGARAAGALAPAVLPLVKVRETNIA